ncbi:unnamed protein product [Danaus chrysippus]|uniref:(African queen) hypothetical protein n=1 Tax=Danaus chrysippus TaxID=151541 RepID=A0A8J2QUV9_9NEOP|nr:unnamed protein product [Danaus chrysippus]
MEHKDLRVLPLHKFPQYLKPCCDLINEEWPRSETARMMSLQASCDHLPTSLILINDQRHILGHCKLSRIPRIPDSCFLESVVIRKSMRGKKLGTYLMGQVENYCKHVLRLKMVYLSTRGQEDFYSKLGYEICEPISIYGGSTVSYKTPIAKNKSLPPKVINNSKDTSIPPPPPMPVPQNINTAVKSNMTYMSKKLS